jgi:hypothetical protein
MLTGILVNFPGGRWDNVILHVWELRAVYSRCSEDITACGVESS